MRSGAFSVRFGDDAHRVTIAPGGEARVDDRPPLTLTEGPDGVLRVADRGTTRQVYVLAVGDRRQVFVDGEVYDVAVDVAGTSSRGHATADLLAAPMPAKVTAVVVQPGQRVRKGDVVVKLEAMKMELAVRAPHDGTVRAVACRVGELVQPGVGLLEIE